MSKYNKQFVTNLFFIVVPIRLQVLKNGERDLTKAVAVVGPDISNVIITYSYHCQSSIIYFFLLIYSLFLNQKVHVICIDVYVFQNLKKNNVLIDK